MARILVVEDNEHVRVALCAALLREGHTVDAHDDGAPVLASVDVSLYDLAIVDLGMPTSGVSVIEVCQRQNGGLPVIAVSGFCDAALEEWLRASGVELLRKPFLPSELASCVAELLEGEPRS